MRDELRRFVDREIYTTDPQYRWQVTWFNDLINRCDAAMEAEAIPEETRTRVIRSIVLGAPNAGEAEQRIEERERLRHQLINSPLSGRWLR